MAKNWSIIIPRPCINLNPTPSFERSGTSRWAAQSPHTFATRVTDIIAKHGAYTGRFQADPITPGGIADVRLGITLAANGTYTIWGYVYVPASWDGGDISFNQIGFTAAIVTVVAFWDAGVSPTNEWVYIESRLTLSSDAAGDIRLISAQAPSENEAFYIDEVQIEEGSIPSSFCSGDQDDCIWLDEPYNGRSQRSEFAASGGDVRNLDDDFDFHTGLDENTGVFPLEMLAQELPLLPGDYLQGIKVASRPNLLLRGGFEGQTSTELHTKRQKLVKALNSRVGRIDEKPQARRLIYHGASIAKEIGVYYVAGLGVGDRIGVVGERIDGLQFYAPDPAWYSRDLRGSDLDPQDTATWRYMARRLAGGSWDAMGPPHASGTYVDVRAIAVWGDYVYIAGDFQNFDNIAAADRIVRFDKRTGAYSAVGTAGANTAILALAVDAQGNLYAVGGFTSIGGISANRIAKWNGSAWSALGTGLSGGNNTVYAVAVGPDGTVYVTGDFTTAGGGGALNIAKWNGSTWSALGTGLNTYARALTVGPDGAVYAGGNFSTAGGTSAARVAKWNGSAWSALGSGISGGDVWALAAAPNGILYAGGQFSTAGGVTVNRVASWNGAAWSALGAGVNGDVYALSFQNGQIVVGGAFTQAGTLVTADRVARWNDSSWARLDANLPGSPNIYALATDSGDLFIGFSTTGTARYAGQTAVAYTGSEKAYPFIVIRNVAASTVRLISIRNETTGAELLFDYAILPFEIITIDLRPNRQGFTSSLFGSRPGKILPSDVAAFYLTPGNGSGAQNNVITAYVDYSSLAPHAAMYWKDTYQSYD